MERSLHGEEVSYCSVGALGVESVIKREQTGRSVGGVRVAFRYGRVWGEFAVGVCVASTCVLVAPDWRGAALSGSWHSPFPQRNAAACY